MSEYETINFGFGPSDEPPAKRPNVVYNQNQSPFGGIGSSVMGKGVRGGVKNSQEYQSQAQKPTHANPFSNGKFLIDFYGSWCGPCQKIAPFFDNLEKLKLVDCFIFNTFEMVLSTKKEVELSAISTIISHPAPTPLINKFGKEISLANSNSEAAKLCFDEKFDACITTMPASKFYNLKIIKNFGEVPMGFAIHNKL